MNNQFSSYKIGYLLILITSFSMLSSCVTKKKKGETSKFGKFFHNLNSYYNGYFNANELYVLSLEELQKANVDNYSKILEVEDFVSVDDPKMVNADMDKAIEKVTRVSAIHEEGDWVDDCYVMMGKAQYLKQDYETAGETMEYFEEEFNPLNPFGLNFKKKKLSSKDKQKIKEVEREEAKKLKDEEKKVQREAREEEKKKLEEDRKEKTKTREQEKKEKEKQREQDKKDRAKAVKERKKSVNRSKKSTDSPKTLIKSDTTSQNTKVDNSQNLDTKNTEPNVNPAKVEKDEKIAPKKEVKKEEDETAYTEGLVWLAKSYIKTDRYSDAEFMLKRVEESEPLSDKVKELLFPAYAELFIKQDRAIEAIPYLDLAMENAASRNLKGRYAFIAGQILQRNKQFTTSGKYFEIAKKNARDFKMKFMADLATTMSSFLSGKKNSEDVTKTLERLLKEEKYSDFKDQIYYSMGEMSMESGNRANAITYFKNSVANNTKDATLKMEAYLHLAELNFENEAYVDAKNYYDSTSVIMPNTDDRYFKIKNLASNLSGIAANIQKIEKYDTLLAMSNLSKEELNKIAMARKAEEEKTGTKIEAPKDSKLITGSRATSANSTFFAYNIASLEKGKADFRKLWGKRKLDDNWRTTKDFDIAIEDSATKVEDVARKEDLSEDEYKRLLGDVPFTVMQKERNKEEIKKALFDLGKQYRDNLQNYTKSIETLEELNRRFPDHGDKAESLYYLALDYIDIGDKAKAKQCQDEIVKMYADTKFAKIISDPSYGEALLTEKNRLESYYDLTYEMFKKEQYQKVQDRIKNATETFGDKNKLIAKFALLNAMCLGSTSGKEAYIKGLQEVITRYPRTPEETKAKEIMRFLGGDKSAFNDVKIEEVDNIYQLEDDKRHYLSIVIFSSADSVLQNAKVSVSEYNKEFHSLEYLQLGDNGLSQTEETQEILIRSFDNRAKAMDYYREVMKDKEKFIPSSIAETYICAITQANHRKMIQARTHRDYQVWFESKYLGDGKK